MKYLSLAGFRIAVPLISLLICFGCRSTATKQAHPLAPPAELPVTTTIATADTGIAAALRPGLVVNIAVLVVGKKEIEAYGKRVSDAGTISLPLLGAVAVNNMTLEDLSTRLTERYKEFFVSPQILVEFVRDDLSNNEGLSPWGSVTVLGRVKRPGRVSIPATRDMSVSTAIQQAGGFDTSAKDTAIRVTHRQPDGSIVAREINLRSVGAQGQVSDDILLTPDDIVFVPKLVF